MAEDDRTRRLLDEVEIRNVIARLAIHADDGNNEAFLSALAEDVHWENRANPERPPIKGRAGFRAVMNAGRAAGVMGPHSMHAVPTSVITVNGDTATVKSYLFFYQNAQTTAAPSCKIYNDTYVRTSDGWKLSVRYIDPV
jgi:hypothetical protein